jgi:glucans biosynthesis protein
MAADSNMMGLAARARMTGTMPGATLSDNRQESSAFAADCGATYLSQRHAVASGRDGPESCGRWNMHAIMSDYRVRSVGSEPSMTEARPAVRGGLARRAALQALAAIGLPWPLLRQALADEGQQLGEPFSYERLVEMTRAKAAQPFAPPPTASDALAALGRAVNALPELQAAETGWSDLPGWQLRPIVPTATGTSLTEVHLAGDGRAQPLPITAEDLVLGEIALPDDLGERLGLAGIAVDRRSSSEDRTAHLRFVAPGRIGALGPNTNGLLYARALAVDTGRGRSEEYPFFRGLWVQRPHAVEDPLRVMALLDSPRIAGAFRFDVVVAEQTRIDVDATLFCRGEIEQLGLAPLATMFLFGAADRQGVDDLRAAVHASDGLLIWTGAGEVLWRPIVNPRELRLSVFVDENPRGFGFIQRARSIAQFEDLSARFERRPNLWVVPRGGWGDGSIRLIEVPTDSDRHDNIVAFWTPAERTSPGDELRLAYALLWSAEAPIDPGLWHVVGTRTGAAPNGARRIAVDFGPPDDAPDAQLPAEVQPEISAWNGTVGPSVVEVEADGRRLRVLFDVTADGTESVELRCSLASAAGRLSEVWLFRLDNI